ncbi:4'-phosphopantetheinyl transferase [Secundilactobacillus pentosiphilus]|uniref:Holo-[acyl-carrier-protein] synthase n=1 Tax=Secundilactobacillus pentosiphilus TaxID=1714682 RepID=A0A1Z5IXS1_9LACO|nr:holo-ACP synthase [Secundilactobacillus pentosiphilus]GAX04527.1 4'-phosphopantetheinyl transferase [Secundilactobacillus pentosiphilus]GAX06261.1 4'-phosphopantetheinyl transferase [Secundilactobacillus pentosiphilus]
MIYGIGVDIEEIGRISAITDQKRFVKKVLTPNEIAVYKTLNEKRGAEFLAGRWSAKEAYSKAYGTGIGQAVSFQNIEILDDETGKPVLVKHPFNGKGFVSISHTRKLVMTQVLLEGDSVE